MSKPVVKLQFLLLTLFLAGCDTYIPSAKKLKSPNNPSRAFIVDGSDFVGITATMDVDSVIYQYETAVPNSEDFWNRIGESSLEHEWEMKLDNEEWKRFVRITPRTGQQVYHSFEEVRIAIEVDTKTVTVAWGQADETELYDDMPSDGGEGEWMNSYLWPRFEEVVTR